MLADSGSTPARARRRPASAGRCHAAPARNSSPHRDRSDWRGSVRPKRPPSAANRLRRAARRQRRASRSFPWADGLAAGSANASSGRSDRRNGAPERTNVLQRAEQVITASLGPHGLGNKALTLTAVNRIPVTCVTAALAPRSARLPRHPAANGRRYSRRTFRGNSPMHPIFLPRGHAATTVPITFVNAGDLARAPRAARFARARLRRRRRLRAEGRPPPAAAGRGRRARRRAVRARARRRRRTRTCSGRERSPASCRRAPIASPMPRTIRSSRRSPSRSAATASRATASRSDKESGSNCPATSTATISPASSRASTWRATSSTRRPTTWGRQNSKRPRARSRAATAPACAPIVGDDLARARISRSSMRSAARRHARRG